MILRMGDAQYKALRAARESEDPMRTITARYAGECRKCLAPIAVGDSAIYERRVGMFCPACAPTDPEEIRELRQEGADRKADRLQEWADKRKAKAEAVFEHNRPMTSDWAFITQPGRIPIRDRIRAQEARQMESLQVADTFERRAESLRAGVRVKGDAEKQHEREREYVRSRLKIGMVVDTSFFGTGTVKKINRKSATIEGCGSSHDYTTNLDLLFIIPPPKGE